MDKYTKTLTMFFRIPLGILCILLGLSLIGVAVWVSTFSDIASMLLIAALIGGGALINLGVGYAFLGDEYKASNIVRDGDTMFTPIETREFLTRRKIVTFIGFISYLLLAVYYLVRTILSVVYEGYLESIDYNSNIIALICFIIISLLIAFFLFTLYKKTKHIDLEE